MKGLGFDYMGTGSLAGAYIFLFYIFYQLVIFLIIVCCIQV